MTDAVIILAAGNSSRLGAPKQLLTFKGKSLIRHAVDTASNLKDVTTFVITGAGHDQILLELEGSNATVINNAGWQQGMSTSIVLGISEIMKRIPDCKTCILAVCDQPYLSTIILKKLKAAQQQIGKGIVASGYADVMGTPVLFTRPYFDKLLDLKGEQGARSLFKQYPQDLIVIPFPKGEIDIDTQEAYDDLQTQE